MRRRSGCTSEWGSLKGVASRHTCGTAARARCEADVAHAFSVQQRHSCRYHFRIDARARLAMLLDGDYEEHDAGMTSTNPLAFEDSKTYAARLEDMKASTELSDALIAASGTIEGRPVEVCAMELKFIGG